MSRRSRLIVSGTPLHIIQRGNNRQACFFAEDDYLFYLESLLQYAKNEGCKVMITTHTGIDTCGLISSGAAVPLMNMTKNMIQRIDVQ